MHTRISAYAAALIISLIGGAATMLILDTIERIPELGFVDPELVVYPGE
ncbi:MAG: hypothetical protein AB199_04355 [Parcubacteria bacterium C7867-004]|nr:MAG: hypothetical protein AB199_04355 [Parcubacteria bacterium C7867-004]